MTDLVTVTDAATGVWSARIGQTLEVVGAGQNIHHVIVRRPGERRTFGMPSLWLDGVENAAPAPQMVPRRLLIAAFTTVLPASAKPDAATSGEASA